MAVRNANIMAARGTLCIFTFPAPALLTTSSCGRRNTDSKLEAGLEPTEMLAYKVTQSLGPRGMDKMVDWLSFKAKIYI